MAFNKVKKYVNRSDVRQMSEEDLDILALMCGFCAPYVEKGLFIKRYYAYYVPIKDSYFDIAKEIFAKSGIEMQTHFSRIINYLGENVLRVNYASVKEEEKLYDIMRKLDNERLILYTDSFKQKRAELYSKVFELEKSKAK